MFESRPFRAALAPDPERQAREELCRQCRREYGRAQSIALGMMAALLASASIALVRRVFGW